MEKSLWDYKHDRPNLPFWKRMRYYAVCYWFEFEDKFLAPVEESVRDHPFFVSFVTGVLLTLLALHLGHKI